MGQIKLGFIGTGNMATAIIGGIIGSKLMTEAEIGVYDVDNAKLEDCKVRGFTAFNGIEELVRESGAVLIAVKPQSFAQVLPQIKAGMSQDKLIISIAAGITAASIKEAMGFDCKLVLAMPNTPLLLGHGATAISAMPPATAEDLDFAKKIFSSAGIAAEISPDKMNEIIPVNGSSPAFFYYFAKLLADSANESGIAPEAAYPMIAQTMLGSAKMLMESGKTPQELIDMVCSPGGATLAGMKALDDNGFDKAISAAAKACVKRAYELAELSKPANIQPQNERREESVSLDVPPVQHTNTGAPWYEESVFYQIYPLGFCGAPEHNDGDAQNRIKKVLDFVPHIRDMGFNAVYFSPIFESDSHGYDTRDYSRIDTRLGANADFAEVCDRFHDHGIRVVLDGVFNHVGRGFWAFEDVRKNRQHSQYKDWFYIDFNRDSRYNDGFYYEGWEGYYNLVKLNLDNRSVRDHIFGCIAGWIEQFGIDGLRLDVAYMLNENFMRELRTFTKSISPDFFLLGEAIHGDYKRIVNPSMLDSATNYECYKGIHSSINDKNMFEIAHSLGRQFGDESWTLYKGMHLLNFVDNHDVSRIASILKDEKAIPAAYGILFGMPGIPCVYYGSEWGEKAEKPKQGSDAPLRPCFDAPHINELTRLIASLARAHRQNPALSLGSYRQIYLTNHQFAFERQTQDNRVVVAINIDDKPHVTGVLPTSGRLFDLIKNEYIEFSGKLELAAYSVGFYRCD